MKIDTTKQPYIPEDWKIESHDTSLGKIDLKNCELYLSEKQKGGKIESTELQKELKGKPVLNATVLDWLLKHPQKIPEEWRGKYVFFWGTIYRNPGGSLCVRCLCFGGGRWGWLCGRFGSGWDQADPALLLASSSDTLTLENRVKSLENDMRKLKRFLVI